MLGAIIGDITGSRLEFTRNRNPAKVTLLPDDGFPTDDTAMTMAVSEWLLDNPDHRSLARVIRKYYFQTAWLSYGARFRRWVWDEEPGNSKGNGCIMRLGAIPLLSRNREEALLTGIKVTTSTHNHPEALRAVNGLLYACYNDWPMAMRVTGWSPQPLKKLRRHHKWTELAEPSVKAVLTCVWHAHSFEEALVNACSIGGDADTLAAAAGTIAELRFGIPHELQLKARTFLPRQYLEIIDAVYARGTQLRHSRNAHHAVPHGPDPRHAWASKDSRSQTTQI